MRTQAFFQNIRQQLIEEINNANIQIVVAVAWFTDKKIFNLLLLKAKKGLDVQIMVADDEINKEWGPNYDELSLLGGVVIKVNAPNPETIMHNKFCIIDRKTVITGSYNWSKRAANNHENITITYDEPLLAEQFLHEFEALKKRYLQFVGNGKLPFDFSKISPRLQMIQSLINLNEFQELELQVEKLKVFDLTNDIEEIINYIKDSYYSDAQRAITQIMERYRSIVSVDVDRKASLKLQLIYLEIELLSLQGFYDDLERVISNFRQKVRIVLGDIILELLDLKIEWNKIREKLGKAFGYENLKEEFKQFTEEVNIAKGKEKSGLSFEDQKELKEYYKVGVQLCHPDKVQDAFKEKAQEIFIRLKKAYDDNDLSEVKRIVIALQNGVWELGPELSELKEVDKLQTYVLSLNLKVAELKKRIEDLSNCDDYKEFKKFENLDQYLEDQKILIKKEIINFQEKILKYNHEQSTSVQ